MYGALPRYNWSVLCECKSTPYRWYPVPPASADALSVSCPCLMPFEKSAVRWRQPYRRQLISVSWDISLQWPPGRLKLDRVMCATIVDLPYHGTAKFSRRVGAVISELRTIA